MIQDIYQHYRPEEQPFIDTVFGWLDQVDLTYAPYTTVFLTPREKMIVEQLVGGREELSVTFKGGYEGAERKQACIYPQYYEPNDEDFSMILFNINFPAKFGKLTHGRILGTFISTGIERERIGDIITDGTNWHALVDASISEYLKGQVTKIANVGVQLEELSFEEILTSEEQWESKLVISSSLRLDTLLSKVYNFSRQRAKNSVSQGDVKVNFVPMVRPDVEIGINDIVSLRKFGRFWINDIEGMTKKDNYRLNVNVLLK
ncbi:RNA-binding protein [Aerococcaceae bacterium DSM 111021]|nr:RNA-binding protein [Aerococcaceae bacterium DSM 111021]